MKQPYELAYEDYVKGMKYKDIAEKYGVTINTVKSWKTRKWNNIENGVHTNEESTHTKKESLKDPEKERIVYFDENKFTDKQQLFIAYFIKYWNATKAYQKAYGSAYSTARTEGCKLLAKPSIREEVKRARDAITDSAFLDKRSLLQKWIDIAFSDITDFVDFGRSEKVAYDFDGNPKIDDNGRVVMDTYSFVNLKDSTEVDGSLISEVVNGPRGIGIKLLDKMKALEYLSKHMDLLNENEIKMLQSQKIKAETEFAEMRAAKLKGETKDTSLLDSLMNVFNE